MNARIVALVGAFALFLAACPAPTPTPDAGQDAGGTPVDNPLGPCTGGCGPSQKCDEVKHACVDACGGCDTGVCTKTASGAFQCVAPATTCGSATCESSKVACIGDTCSCLPFTRASSDTCAADGRICNGAYNPAAAGSGNCEAPKLHQACKTVDCTSGTCAACPTGTACTDGIFSGESLCAKTCPCGPGELCWSTKNICLPAALFGDEYGCSSFTLPDGGTLPDAGMFTVPVANPCLLKNDEGVPTETVATGNCTYEFFTMSTRSIPLSSCNKPGGANLHDLCKRDRSAATIALQCGTGLECALTREDTGQCLKTCNAATPRFGFTPTPSCGTGEECVNLYRLEDLNSVVGVCMNRCDLFSTGSSTCPDYGSVKASCVPVPADGRSWTNTDGSGVCVPQKATVANAGEACSETDPFKGAACATGLVCRAGANGQATCVKPCDLSCAVANPPARCASQPNATCSAGKTCRRVTQTTGATLGFCE